MRLFGLAMLLFLALHASGPVHAQGIARDGAVVIEARYTDDPWVTGVGLDQAPLQEQSTPSRLAARMANFHVADGGAHGFNDTYSLRGLSNTPQFGTAAITAYLDEVPLGSSFTIPAQLTGFSQAELFRGPGQNTRFGHVGSAGVLQLVTPEPGREPSIDATLGLGNYSDIGTSATFATSADTWGDALLSAAANRRDGYVRNDLLERNLDDRKLLSGLARVRLRLSDALQVKFLAVGQRARDGAQPMVPLDGPLYHVSRSSEGYTDLDWVAAGVTVSLSTSAGTLNVTTSVNDWRLGPYASVLAFGPAELANSVDQRQRTWSEEARWLSRRDAPLRWELALFGSVSRTEGAFDRAFGGMSVEKSSFSLHADDLAAYAEMSVDLSGNTELIAGLRAENSARRMWRVENVPNEEQYRARSPSAALLPRIELRHVLAPQMQAFVSAGTGYKPGGFSAFTGNRTLSAFGPERNRALEAGITRAAGDRFMATLRVFRYDLRGYQIERSFATGADADDYLVVNAPRALSSGAELELRWRPLARLDIEAGLGRTRAVLKRFTDPYTSVSYAGEPVPFSPAYDGSLRVSYRGIGGWFATAALTSNGTIRFTEANEPAFRQEPCALFDASVGYASSRWRVTAYSENLSDKRYFSAISAGAAHGTPGRPRTFGVQLAMTVRDAWN